MQRNAFTAYLTQELGLAHNTVVAYRGDIAMFSEFVWRLGQNVDSFDHSAVSRFVSYRSQCDDRPPTLKRRLAAIRTLLRYQVDAGTRILAQSKAVSDLIESPKADGRKLPDVLSPSQMTDFLQGVYANETHALRNAAMMELCYSSGLRCSELINVKRKDIDFTARTIRVFGKGGKERIVPITRAAAEATERYYDSDAREYACGNANPRPVEMFLSKNGKPLSRSDVNDVILEIKIARKIAKRMSAHTLRHCFASHLVSGGANLRVVQELLGHSDIATTGQYVHLDFAALKKARDLLGR